MRYSSALFVVALGAAGCDGDPVVDAGPSACPMPAPGECALGPEDTIDACGDGCDNDEDGFMDCADFGCSREATPEVMAYCDSILEQTMSSCTDGVDNDCNGFTDCADFGCSRSPDPAIAALCEP